MPGKVVPHRQVTTDDPSVYMQAFTIAFLYRRSAIKGFEMLEEACYENNEELLKIYRTVGLSIYPGISAEEARHLVPEN